MNLVQITITLAGGLALFLFGMDQLTSGLKLAAGPRLKSLLARLTSNRFRGALAGAFVTAIVQSSSVTTVMLIGFLSAGLLTLTQSIGVIMGANIGTTVTAQIVAFDIARYGLLGFAVGFATQFGARSSLLKHVGVAVMGLGLVFFGMELMGQATEPLRTYPPFLGAMQSLESPAIGILAGAAFTAVVQSSSATTALVIVLASSGVIRLEAGIALIFGANIGTCVTAVIASVGRAVEARQAAAVHVLFNVVGVLLWLGFIDQLAQIVQMISPSSAYPDLQARLAADTPRQIANAHTVFNVTNTLVLIWFVKPIRWVVAGVVRARGKGDARIAPRYLDDALLATPDLALDRVRMELRRVGDRIIRMVEEVLPVVVHGSMDALARIRARDVDVDVLYAEVVAYLSSLSQGNLTDEHARTLHTYLRAATLLESIGDVVEQNMYEIGRKRLEAGIEMSAATVSSFTLLHEHVCHAVRLACQAFDAGSAELADKVVESKPEVEAIWEELAARLSHRVGAPEADRRALFQMESELLEYLKRVYYFARQIAKGTVWLHGDKPEES